FMMLAVNAEYSIRLPVTGFIPGIRPYLSSSSVFGIAAPIVQVKYFSLVLCAFRPCPGMGVNRNQIYSEIPASGVLHFLCCLPGRVSHGHIDIGFRRPFPAALVHKCRYSFSVKLTYALSDSLLSGLRSHG